MDSAPLNLEHAWAQMQEKWNSPAEALSPTRSHVPRGSLLHRTEHNIRLHHLWTAMNVVPLMVLALWEPTPWLRGGIAVVVALSLHSAWQLQRIQWQLKTAHRQMDQPLAQYLKNLAEALEAWRTTTLRQSVWQLPFSGGLGMAWGLSLSLPPDGPWMENPVMQAPRTWALLISSLALLTGLGYFAMRRTYRRSFERDERNLREWANGLSGEGE
jgi:hypothetical protein